MKLYDIKQIKELLATGRVIYDGEAFEIIDKSIKKVDFYESLMIALKDLKNSVDK